MAITFDDIDLFDFDRFQRGEHHEMLRFLRNDGNGIHRLVDPDGEPFWNLTRWHQLKEVNRQPLVFSSEVDGTQIRTTPPEEREGDMRQVMITDIDPPKHTRYRSLVSSGFTPRMVRLLEDYVANRSAMVVDAVCERGECDLVTDLAAELPLQAIADMMGVPYEDRAKIFHWANQLVGNSDPEFAPSVEEAMGAAAQIFGYAHEIRADREANPRDDIVTALLNAEVDGSKLTDFEFDVFFLLLCIAGSETTRNTISDGINALTTNPDQWALLLSDLDAHLDGAVEESLRWSTPVLHFRRTAVQDYELDGVKIAAGEKVVFWHASANRDERVFDDPYRFDITRSPNDHVTFGGGGPHFCIGANLARMEMKVLFREIAERLPDVHPTAEPSYLRGNFLRGMKHLPVAFTPTPSTGTEPIPYIGYSSHTRRGVS
jgi:cholest-4-en-3-one 26-monooxygenase